MQKKGHFVADSKDFGGEAVVVVAAVPGSAVDSSTLHLMQIGVQFGTAVPVSMDLEPNYTGAEVAAGAAAVLTHVGLQFDRWNYLKMLGV
eukprot:scaffold10799_cov126-Skeletonema_menzelii.AAC.1